MSSPAWWNRVIDQVNSYHLLNPSNLPGAVFAAQTLRDGPLLSSLGNGWANNTICNIASMSKPFVATAVLMALEEQDLLDIERPVCELPGMEAYAKEPLKSQIKVRHLLQHTSGLPSIQRSSDSPQTSCNDPSEGAASCEEPNLNLGPTVPWTGSPGVTNECIHADGRCQPARQLSLDEVSSYLMQTYSPSHQPGTKFSLNELGYTVAARIVEQLTGKSINIYLKEKLFQPLAMSDSFFIAQRTGDPIVDSRIDEGVTHHQRARIADLTLITRDGLFPPEIAPGPDGGWDKFRRGWRYVFPEGGMYSTAGDLLRYLGMLRDGGESERGRILTKEVVRLLVEDQGFGHTMGFGYTNETNRYGQGARTLDHLGRFMTYIWYDPRPGDPLLGVFLSQRLTNVAVNSNLGDGTRVIFRLFIPSVEAGVFGDQPPDSV